MSLHLSIKYYRCCSSLKIEQLCHMQDSYWLGPVFQAGIQCLIICLPVLAFQYSAWLTFCQGGVVRPWCSGRLPNVYSFVQSHYWGVGLFKYFKVQQASNSSRSFSQFDADASHRFNDMSAVFDADPQFHSSSTNGISVMHGMLGLLQLQLEESLFSRVDNITANPMSARRQTHQCFKEQLCHSLTSSDPKCCFHT